MPYIKEEDLVSLHSKLDKATIDKEEIQKGYIDLKLKSNKNNKKLSIYKIIALITSFLCIAMLVFWFLNKGTTKKELQEARANELILKDSIQKMSAVMKKTGLGVDSGKLVYLIQIGNFKNIDLFNKSDKVSNFQQIKKRNYNTYLMGGFTSYVQAKSFKDSVQKLGIKDAFIVAYKDKERIDIREALKLSNEESYIK